MRGVAQGQLRTDLDALEADAKATIELNRGSHHPDMSAYTHAVRLERAVGPSISEQVEEFGRVIDG